MNKGTVQHQLDHALVGLAVYEAGRSLTKRRQLALLVLAAAFFVRTHQFHHGRRT